jgi:VIT family protein
MQVVRTAPVQQTRHVDRSERLLDPIARTSEVLFGVIMALTFTGTLSAATAGRDEIRTLLAGMIGCNIAWGLVDAVMFLMTSLSERGHDFLTLRAVRRADQVEHAYLAIASSLPPLVASILTTTDLERLRVGLIGMRDLPRTPGLTKEDWVKALAVFLLVFFSTFPLVLPFLVFRDVDVALRSSNVIAIVLMFATGYWLGEHGGYNPWRTGLSVALLGVVLVGITIALGG